MTLRVRAPELTGRGWLNTGGAEIRLADLRGRVVVLDFWTFCCVNCLHVLDELRPLEERFGDRLVLIGVHSPKFEHEADPQALADAVERYAVHHPVLDDPELTTWGAYTARAWPTLAVVDPEGYLVASLSGEGHAHGLSVLVAELLAEHEARGTLATGPGPYVPPEPASTPLRFPGKAAACGDGSLLVSDTAHHQVVHLEADLSTERARYGSPQTWTEPQGVLVLPEEVAARAGVDVLVADAVGHRIAGIRLSDGQIRAVAGTGEQLRERGGRGPALEQALSTPWDLAWWEGRVVIAMAGTHQLWELDLDAGTVGVLAGTSAEGIRDGDGEQAWFAQPSGLAVGADGTLWVADAETSALRSVRREGTRVQVRTHVGQGLFDFGHRDGPAGQALLQHPLGVTALPDGSVLVCDTYNGALRRYDPAGGQVGTLASGLREPSDALVLGGEGLDRLGRPDDELGRPDDQLGRPDDELDRRDSGEDRRSSLSRPPAHLVVVESAAHTLTALPLPERMSRVDGLARQTRRPPTALAAGPVRLEVAFTPPSGQKLDDRYGDPTRLMVSATPEALLRDGAGTAPGLVRELVLDGAAGSGILHISVRAAACDGGPGGEVPEHAACHLYQQDWGIPVVLEQGAAGVLRLDLRGT